MEALLSDRLYRDTRRDLGYLPALHHNRMSRLLLDIVRPASEALLEWNGCRVLLLTEERLLLLLHVTHAASSETIAYHAVPVRAVDGVSVLKCLSSIELVVRVLVLLDSTVFVTFVSGLFPVVVFFVLGQSDP